MCDLETSRIDAPYIYIYIYIYLYTHTHRHTDTHTHIYIYIYIYIYDISSLRVKFLNTMSVMKFVYFWIPDVKTKDSDINTSTDSLNFIFS